MSQDQPMNPVDALKTIATLRDEIRRLEAQKAYVTAERASILREIAGRRNQIEAILEFTPEVRAQVAPTPSARTRGSLK